MEIRFSDLGGLTVLVDQQTVRDLEIFQTRDGKAGVFQTLDMTKTPGGSLALRRRFFLEAAVVSIRYRDLFHH